MIASTVMAIETVLIGFEWHETLCCMNIIPCGTTHGHSCNRLWDDYGFAPQPPVRP